MQNIGVVPVISLFGLLSCDRRSADIMEDWLYGGQPVAAWSENMMNSFAAVISGLVLCLGWGAALWAGEADVLNAEARRDSDGTFRFSVTLHHDDAGWDHYADRWDVLALDGTVLATRVLLHPHVGEQPFTRSLSGVEIPPTNREVIIRGGDSVHGFGGAEWILALPE